MEVPQVYTVWVALDTGEYLRLRSFQHEEVANKFLEYANCFFEYSDDYGNVEDLFVKVEGMPVYQIYHLNPDGTVATSSSDSDNDNDDNSDELEDEKQIYVNLDELIEELQNLTENNPYTEYGYNEIDIDEEAETYEVHDL